MPQDLDLLDGLDVAIPDLEGDLPGSSDQPGASFFGPYQLIQEVGQGGVAKVMRARHIHPHYGDRVFAVKVLHEQLCSDPKVIALFRREAYVLALLKHPNVVQTFEAGAQDERLFIAMEYIDGRDLDELIMRLKTAQISMPQPVLLHIICEVLKGLHFAHELRDYEGERLNLIHRDVNPANVFVAFDGRVKLGDFGVASITAGRVEKSRELAGKVGFFAPEQLAGDLVDHRADIFAVGVILFEVLCGVRLFEADDTNEALRLNKRAKIPRPSKLNPSISAELEKVMLRALERKPADRFDDAAEMIAALQPFLAEFRGLHLAVASAMRQVFVAEQLHELGLRQALAGRNLERGEGQTIHICSADARTRAAFTELLEARGFRTQAHAGQKNLEDSLRQGSTGVILMDITDAAFSPTGFSTAMSDNGGANPVIAIAMSLSMTAVRAASQIGATDILFRPFTMKRVLNAVHSALLGALPTETAPAKAGRRLMRILLISRDAALAVSLQTGMQALGFLCDAVEDGAAALSRSQLVSYEVILYDAFPWNPADREFVGAYRKLPGMGIAPVVFLAEPQTTPLFVGMLERTAVLNRDVTPAALEAALHKMRRDNQSGRSFVRVECEVPAELRYAGRLSACTALNLARGGASVLCDNIPTVGTAASITLRPPGSRPFEIHCHVVRVNLVKYDLQDAAMVGMEFHGFLGSAEADLIGYLALLQRNGAASDVTLRRLPLARP